MFENKEEENKALNEWSKTLDENNYVYLENIFQTINSLEKEIDDFKKKKENLEKEIDHINNDKDSEALLKEINIQIKHINASIDEDTYHLSKRKEEFKSFIKNNDLQHQFINSIYKQELKEESVKKEIEKKLEKKNYDYLLKKKNNISFFNKPIYSSFALIATFAFIFFQFITFEKRFILADLNDEYVNSYAFIDNSELTVMDIIKKYKDSNKDIGVEYPEEVELIAKNDEQQIRQSFVEIFPESFKIMTLRDEYFLVLEKTEKNLQLIKDLKLNYSIEKDKLFIKLSNSED